MKRLPTLRRELVTAFALVFAGALLVAAGGITFMLPRLASPEAWTLYVVVLLAADVLVFAVFGSLLLRRRLWEPLDGMIGAVEAIAAGEHERRVPPGETEEMERLGTAVNRMAERLLSDQRELAANIRSLDDTNRMLTEARDAMVRSEKLASVGRLSAGIAHEVGNPLGAILGYIGLLGRDADGRQAELLSAAEREARRIDRIVHGLLDYARPRETRETREQRLDVNAVLADTLELVSTQGRFARLEVERNFAHTLPPVAGDPYQLQQVFVNLFVNAADALEETAERHLEITTAARAYHAPQHRPARRKDDPPGIDYSHRRRLAAAVQRRVKDPRADTGQVVEVIVRDNGPGMEAELLEQIFEPFVTTKEPGRGTGLGLAVCARIVENMGGTIRAESVVGEGSAFVLVFPAAVPAQPSESER
ncbi:MAG: ATP-binding protein [Gemmatimonadota bacterium]